MIFDPEQRFEEICQTAKPSAMEKPAALPYCPRTVRSRRNPRKTNRQGRRTAEVSTPVRLKKDSASLPKQFLTKVNALSPIVGYLVFAEELDRLAHPVI